MTRTAVITGGTGGMGLATARILGKDHRVVLADLDQGRLDTAVATLVAEGIDAAGSVCDVTDRGSVDALFSFAAEGDHHVRAVVHAAGVSPQMGSAEFVARINAIGTVHVSRAYLEGDVLVNVASVAGHSIPKALVPTRSFPLAETDPAPSCA
ncbi:SDR family NAD(P)-dependent oxidoreductase [Candidatus Frankia nodulisporulans]|uniref:SDR family NAD(P)-dependent oxidoreductase n=1 Tax=Candidatus Frankia nodulisporulans TaxID=2060052 RepID=UPI001C2EFE9A|nr:SDR family NAD(P)-dependent oxidoreductase [Candidatus Frankia nodulisporulans]